MGCSRQVLASLLAGLCVLGVSADARGLVLCFGADGHVEIEAAHAASCVDVRRSCAEGPASGPVDQGCARQDEHHCGMCVDIPLVDPGWASDKPAVPGTAVCVAAPEAWSIDMVPAPTELIHPAPDDLVCGTLAFLRVTILVI